LQLFSLTKHHFRSQVNSLNYVHRKETDAIKNTLKEFKCGNCSQIKGNDEPKPSKEIDSLISFKPIGLIRTVFAEKRAVPRQANIAEAILSRIELSKEVYTNPEQSLETLDDFSHFWIIYHFHKNDSHSKPKISPPRLDGKKVGTFATRSPHRPNPIGISLVRLDRIEGSTIYFYGSDMVDCTPVIDIKPYIPDYDSPNKASESIAKDELNESLRSREEPEGEEEPDENSARATSTAKIEPKSDVKVPNWVSSNNKLLKVIFSDNALQQIKELKVNQKSIEEILENDPRSVYVREKYLSQIYDFQVDGNNVICKFDDKLRTVTVLKVRKIVNMSE
jgi:tRNA (adenine37-N6)-methyltransferase